MTYPGDALERVFRKDYKSEFRNIRRYERIKCRDHQNERLYVHAR